jgi:hypothetical protein
MSTRLLPISDVEADKSITRHTGRKIVATTVIVAVIAASLFVFLLRPKPETAVLDSRSSHSEKTPIPEKQAHFRHSEYYAGK